MADALSMSKCSKAARDSAGMVPALPMITGCIVTRPQPAASNDFLSASCCAIARALARWMSRSGAYLSSRMRIHDWCVLLVATLSP